MKQLTKVLVGSRLHGLANEHSDYDYRGVHIHDLKSVLSPFATLKNTTWIEGDEDNTSYELADFCKQAIHGNATILEVFFSDQIIETTPIADEMRANWRKFIDTDKVVMASRGYASNQLNKMELFDDIGRKDQRRTSKFAIAYCRVLWQCSEFLRTGEFPCQITDPDLRAFLLTIKAGWDDKYIPECTERFTALQAEVTRNWKNAEKSRPDIEWIEGFIYRAYRSTDV
ncbi:DNA polymerase beta superfamily protein [Antrihabitans sp. YC2-6]|uniref:nucleotidyltransferase domain-containing protein n=1 Tax=Antrihabitans sp. YC2-6 TaxID=2799498 RepID=UPI0018F79CED|nr:nucleotidyltransferase domain-containing protein [Antrihabitans sp. YC2-6]MBJ8343961.1 nucleotidyltransferase domain-containing protein [Antrihabitans sp. YC2-6]